MCHRVGIVKGECVTVLVIVKGECVTVMRWVRVCVSLCWDSGW